MAKIKTYEQDTNISDDDLLIGTDAEDSNKTKNYSIGQLKDHIRLGSPDRIIDVPTGTVIKTILKADWDGLGLFPSLTFIRQDTLTSMSISYSFDSAAYNMCIINFGTATTFDIKIKLT